MKRPKHLLGICLLSLSITGCANWAANRVTHLDRTIAAADAKLAELAERSIVSQSPEDIAALEKAEAQVVKLEAERQKALEDARNESESNRSVWLVLLATVTGGIKVATDIARKAAL